jgi:putative exosortase-associated protein (TIGR04073 family)
MKKLLCSLLLVVTAAACYGDIQDPPANDYGPTRKLARALANLCPLTAFTEYSSTIALENNREGNSAAATAVVVKGLGRFVARMGFGWYEFFTFPFPTYKGSYRPFYRDNVPWVHGGYEEFPPELGYKTKYDYTQADGLSY